MSAWSRESGGCTHNGVGGGEDATVGDCPVILRENLAAVVDFFAVRILHVVDAVTVCLPLRCASTVWRGGGPGGLTTSTLAPFTGSPRVFLIVAKKYIGSPVVPVFAREHPEGNSGAPG